MILPIHIYGDPVLREEARAVESVSEETERLIDDLIETMHGASGLGLAAPQVGRSVRIFVADLSPMAEEIAREQAAGESGPVPLEPLVFINPEIVEETGVPCDFEEGCLSIPELREVVSRPDAVRLRFRDRFFRPQEIEAKGLLARVVQHELDHLNGVLFIDRISPFRRRLLRRRLREIAAGQVEADYPLAVADAAKAPRSKSR